MNGDVILDSVKGNRNFGNEVVESREILLDLRLRVYYIDAKQLVLKLSSVITTFFCYNGVVGDKKCLKGKILSLKT